MIRTYNLAQIRSVLRNADLLSDMEEGFVLYSKNEVVVPPVGHLGFTKPPGDVHIKYGYIQNDDYYVIKIASGFYDNPKNNLPSSDGLMLLFQQKTGRLEAILADEGYLTDMRTAAAGAVVAKYLAPKDVQCIGIIGAGVQATLQLQFLKEVVDCRNVVVWGRDGAKLAKFQEDLSVDGFTISITQDMDEVTQRCNLIVTTTPSKVPLLFADKIRKGTHITGVGADTKEKQELDPSLFSVADIVVVDSIDQCVDHGDTAHAMRAGIVQKVDLVELGNVIREPSYRRQNDDQITIADLTGVAVQDIQIAKHVYRKLSTAAAVRTEP